MLVFYGNSLYTIAATVRSVTNSRRPFSFGVSDSILCVNVIEPLAFNPLFDLDLEAPCPRRPVCKKKNKNIFLKKMEKQKKKKKKKIKKKKKKKKKKKTKKNKKKKKTASDKGLIFFFESINQYCSHLKK